MQAKTNAHNLTKILEEFPVRTFPALGRFIVNKLAFEARKQAVKRVKRQFITRNRFTTSNIQYVSAPRTRKLKDVESSYGATDRIEYMKDQEEGTTIKPQSGQKLPVPTKLARRSSSIEKLKRARFKMNSLGNLRKTSEMRGATKKQRTIALIQDMARKKQRNRLAILPFSRKPGIYKVLGSGKERKGMKSRVKYRLRLIYDLSKRSLRLKPSPWMAPVNDGIFKNQSRIAEAAFNRYIKSIR